MLIPIDTGSLMSPPSTHQKVPSIMAWWEALLELNSRLVGVPPAGGSVTVLFWYSTP